MTGHSSKAVLGRMRGSRCGLGSVLGRMRGSRSRLGSVFGRVRGSRSRLESVFGRVRGTRSRLGVTVLVTAAISLLAASPAGAMTIRRDHPRLLLNSDDLGRLRARCGIRDGNNQIDHPTQWGTHANDYRALRDYVAALSPELDHLNGRTWSQSIVRVYSRYLAAAAFEHLLSGSPATAELQVGWWRQILADSRAINSGAVGPSVSGSNWGEDASWKGFCLSYDYMYEFLGSDHSALRDSIALWLYKQTGSGWREIGGAGSLPVEGYKHYYRVPWVADGVFGVILAAGGDPGSLGVADSLAARLAWTHAFKQADMEVRAKNHCGTYAGYRPARVQEDVTIALAWQSATDERPLEEYSYHFDNIDDWVMYMCRPGFKESDETGDSHDLYLLDSRWVHYAYPMAVREWNPSTLWFLDQAYAAVAVEPDPWKQILWNDRALARVAPTGATLSLGRYFGDLTLDDGHNSQYAHWKSAWAYAGPSSQDVVQVTYLCGPLQGGHDDLSNGHFAIFRGQDILTASTGVYDGTNAAHTRYWHSSPISENTILVVDSANPYARGDSVDIVTHAEGMQASAPGTTGGGGLYVAEDAYDYRHEFGSIRKFANRADGTFYIMSDLTSAYPNKPKADLWPAGQTVESVTRQLSIEAGRFVVVCDRVESVRASAVKRVVVHCPSPGGFTLLDGDWDGGQPTVAGPYGGTPGQSASRALSYRWERGASRMFSTVLYPAPADRGGEGRELVRVGGTNRAGEWNAGPSGGDPSYEFYLRQIGRNVPWVDTYISDSERNMYLNEGWAGYWRMEIEATGAKQHAFLHVYEPVAITQSDRTPVSYLEDLDGNHVGSRIEIPGASRVTIFGRDETPGDRVIYQSLLDTPHHHLLADLQPGIYRVRHERFLRGSSAAVAEWLVEAGEDGLATFETDTGGSFTVLREGPPMIASRH